MWDYIIIWLLLLYRSEITLCDIIRNRRQQTIMSKSTFYIFVNGTEML